MSEKLDLRSLNLQEVSEQTHITKSILEDITNKRFENLNAVKAKGFIKILEHRYNLDLSDLLYELESFHVNKMPTEQVMDKLRVEADEINKSNKFKAWMIIPIILIVVVMSFLTLSSKNELNLKETNLSTDTNDTNISALLNTPLEFNSSDAIQKKQDTNNTIEDNTSTNIVQKISFQAMPAKELWLGIYYLDNNKTDFRDKLTSNIDLNESRPQIIVAGPGFISIKIADSVITSKTDNVVRYIYDPKTKQLKYITRDEFEQIRPTQKKI